MQVMGNPFAIGQDSQLTGMFAAAGDGQCDSGVVSEITYQFQIAGVEWLLTHAARDGDNAHDRAIGSKRHHDRGPFTDVGKRLDRDDVMLR